MKVGHALTAFILVSVALDAAALEMGYPTLLNPGDGAAEIAVTTDGVGGAYHAFATRDRDRVFLSRTVSDGQQYDQPTLLRQVDAADDNVWDVHVCASGDASATALSTVLVLWREARGAGGEKLEVRRSSDQGRTWPDSPTEIFETGTGTLADPALSCNAAGSAAIAWVAVVSGQQRVWTATSQDGGAHWNAPSIIGQSGHPRRPALALGFDYRVSVAWESTDGAGQPVEVRVAGTSNGLVWHIVDQLIATPDVGGLHAHRDPALVFGPSGALYIAWAATDAAGGGQLLTSCSRDLGASWSDAFAVNRRTGPVDEVLMASPLTVDPWDPELRDVVAWGWSGANYDGGVRGFWFNTGYRDTAGDWHLAWPAGEQRVVDLGVVPGDDVKPVALTWQVRSSLWATYEVDHAGEESGYVQQLLDHRSILDNTTCARGSSVSPGGTTGDTSGRIFTAWIEDRGSDVGRAIATSSDRATDFHYQAPDDTMYVSLSSDPDGMSLLAYDRFVQEYYYDPVFGDTWYPGPGHVMARSTRDGGSTFAHAFDTSGECPDCNFERVASATTATGAGGVVMRRVRTIALPDTLWFKGTSDYGKTWSPLVRVEHYAGPDRFQDNPRLCLLPDGHVFVAVSRGPLTKLEAFVTSSSDYGRTWAPSDTRLFEGFQTADARQAACNGIGAVYVVARARQQPSDSFETWLASSSDFGHTWQNFRLQDTPSASHAVSWNCLAADPADGVLFTWSASAADGGGVYFRKYTGYGAIRGPVVKLDVSDAGNVYAAQSAPVLDAANGRVIVAWADTHPSSSTFAQLSKDGGRGWLPSEMALDAPGQGGSARNPRVRIVADGRASVSWTDQAQGGSSWSSLLVVSRLGGEPGTWTAPVSLSTSDEERSVGFSRGLIHVIGLTSPDWRITGAYHGVFANEQRLLPAYSGAVRGLRWSDLSTLTWDTVDDATEYVISGDDLEAIEQSPTGELGRVLAPPWVDTLAPPSPGYGRFYLVVARNVLSGGSGAVP